VTVTAGEDKEAAAAGVMCVTAVCSCTKSKRGQSSWACVTFLSSGTHAAQELEGGESLPAYLRRRPWLDHHDFVVAVVLTVAVLITAIIIVILCVAQ
jgi:hypothetical protein